jgi:uncharacterized membrane protein
VFSGLGAVIVGLGVILFFAYNWASMPKFAKLGTVFAALALAHGGAFYLRRPSGEQKEIGETLHVFGTMLFGAGIFLVGQIYHIDEHYPNAFLAWGGAALVLAWVLPSIAHGAMAALLFLLWGGFESIEFRHGAPAPPLILLFGLGPLAWLLRSRILLIATIAGVHLALAFAFSSSSSEVVMPLLACAATTFCALGELSRRWSCDPIRPSHFTLIPSIFSWGLLYALTFDDIAREILEPIDFEKRTLGGTYFIVAALAAAVSWTGLLLQWVAKRAEPQASPDPLRFEALIVPVALAVMMSSWLGSGWGMQDGGFAAALCFNVLFVAGAVALMIAGLRRIEMSLVAAGCLLIAVLAATRYVDLFESLLVRSLIFVITGSGIFAIGVAYSRAKRRHRVHESLDGAHP